MPVAVTDLSALPAADVQSNLDETVQRLSEANPQLDLKRGVVHDLVALPNALLATARQSTLARYLSARSPIDVAADPTLADTEVLDRILSNWGVTREAGAAARGEVTVVLGSPASVTIGSGSVFTANGVVYRSDAAYTAKQEPGQINSADDRLLIELSDGNWAFTVNVTAATNGAAGLARKDSLVVPSALPTDYVTSYATSDFTAGVDAENNAAVLERLLQGVSAKGPSNRVNMNAAIRAVPEFNRVVRTSIVGFGDAAMLRDKHNTFGVASGGRVDWYVRTQERVETRTLVKTATLVGLTAEGTSWQIAFGRDEAPGFYEIASVRRRGETPEYAAFSVTREDRGVDFANDVFRPDIQTPVEAVYSRYQTVVIRFTDTRTPTAGLLAGATAQYDVAVRVMPTIADVQDHFNARDVRPYGSDLLIKAPVPCYVAVAFTVVKSNVQAVPDLTALRNAVAAAVNAIDFTGRIYAGQIQDVIHGYLPQGASARDVDLYGRVRMPDGEMRFSRDRDAMVVSRVPGRMVDDTTVQFFCDPADVTIAVSTEIPTQA